MQTTITNDQTAATYRFFGGVQNTDTTVQSWQCHYQADDDLFLAPNHTFFTGITVPQCMDKLGMRVLNIRIDMYALSAPQLRNARIRVMVRNSTGSAVLNWQSDTLARMDRPVTGGGYPMCFALPLGTSVCQRIQPGNTYRLYVMLEDSDGHIIDDASGRITFTTRHC